MPSAVSSGKPPPAASTGSSTRGASKPFNFSATVRTSAGVASIPTLTAATGKSLSTASSCAATTSGATGWTAVTPRLFWTVRAVTTVRP